MFGDDPFWAYVQKPQVDEGVARDMRDWKEHCVVHIASTIPLLFLRRGHGICEMERKA